MSDLSAAEARWSGWVASTSEALGIDASSVDIEAIHALTKTVAHGLDRPLAPVSSYLLGVAVGVRLGRGEVVGAAERARLQRLIEDTVPVPA